jgi:NDP-sugar pyrophosphorylase family protein
MKAMIFAAGLGTRFKPWTDEHPKALAIVNNKSLLQRNIEYLQQYGIIDVVVNVHHFADQVIEAIKNNKGWGSNIVISDERNELLETGGGLLKAQTLLQGTDPFITLNADILTDLPLDDLLMEHKKNKALITLGVSNRLSSRNFLFNDSKLLCGWENVTSGDKKIVIHNQKTHSKAYSCVAVFEPNVFGLIPQRGKFSLTETYLSLTSEYPVYGYEYNEGRFIDVGKPESVDIAEKMFL